MKKAEKTNTAKKTTPAAGTNAKPNQHIEPERKVLDASEAARLAARCSNYNDSKNEARNLKFIEVKDTTFCNEDLSGAEMQYSRYENCQFIDCKLSRIDGHFMEFVSCQFTNTDLENADLSYAKLTNVKFIHCNLNGIELPFTCGDFTCSECMAKNLSAQNANLQLTFTRTNAWGLEANSATLKLDIEDSNLKRAEFNDGKIMGKIVRTDMSSSEFNHSNISALEFIDSATSGMEMEKAEDMEDMDSDDDFENDIAAALRELEE